MLAQMYRAIGDGEELWSQAALPMATTYRPVPAPIIPLEVSVIIGDGSGIGVVCTHIKFAPNPVCVWTAIRIKRRKRS